MAVQPQVGDEVGRGVWEWGWERVLPEPSAGEGEAGGMATLEQQAGQQVVTRAWPCGEPQGAFCVRSQIGSTGRTELRASPTDPRLMVLPKTHPRRPKRHEL